MSLTLAKLTRPDTDKTVPRKRLAALLDRARHQPIIWISAPAGAGKTALISSYIESSGEHALWYQVDAGDADIASFFHYFGLALKGFLHSRKKLPVLTPEYQQGVAEFTRNYFRKAFQHLTTPGLLVLDNFQDAGLNSELHEMLAIAFDEVPTGINVIIISRFDPPRPFARLIANQKLCLIGGDELCCTLDEGLAIAQKLYPNREITQQHLKQLDRDIQGWVTGLILWLAQGGETEEINLSAEELNQEHLFDYFFIEIFRKLDTETQQFLIETATLPKMTITICRQLTKNRAAKKILAELLRKHCFTTRHGKLKPHYEYHPLFRAFLRNQAQEQLSETQYSALQSRAGVLLAEAGSVDAAIQLLINGKNWPALTELLLKHAKKEIEHGRNRQLISWINALPCEVAEHPWLDYWYGMSHLQYDHSAARSAFEKAYDKFKETSEVLGLYLSWCGIADTYTFAHASFAGANRWLDQLAWLQQAHPKPPSMEARGHLIFSAAQLTFWVQPNHPALPGWMEKMETIYRFVPNKFLVVMSIVQLSIYYGQSGETAKIRNINRRIEKLISKLDNNLLLKSLLLMTRYANDWMTADFALSYEVIDDSFQRINAEGVKTLSGLMLAHTLYHAACQHDLPRMKRLIDTYGEMVNSESLLDRGHYQLHLSYYEILCGNFGQAIQHGSAAVELVDQANAPLPIWVSYSMLSYACIEVGQLEQANEHLERVHQVVGEINTRAASWVYHMIRSYLEFKQEKLKLALEHLKTCFRLGREKEMKASAIWPPRLISTLCGLALENNIEPDYARQIINHYRYTPKESLCAGEQWPWPVKIYTLGRFGVLINEQAIDVESRPFDLLKALLTFGGRNVHTDKIMDTLWPDADGDQARASFKTTLHRMRKILGTFDILILKNHRLSLNEKYAWVDTWAISRLFERVEPTIHNREIRQNIELADKLIKQYRGLFLANESTGWVIQQQRRLHQRTIRHITALAHAIESECSHSAAPYYQHILEIDPLLPACNPYPDKMGVNTTE